MRIVRKQYSIGIKLTLGLMKAITIVKDNSINVSTSAFNGANKGNAKERVRPDISKKLNSFVVIIFSKLKLKFSGCSNN